MVLGWYHGVYYGRVRVVLGSDDPDGIGAVHWDPTHSASSHFGRQVSNAGDVNGDGVGDILVSSSHEDNNATDEGFVRLYYGSPSNFSGGSSVDMDIGSAGDESGRSVAIIGDVNGDGFDDVAVGAPYYSNGNTAEGAVYIHHGTDLGIDTNPAVVLEGGIDNANFGYAALIWRREWGWLW